MKTDYLVRPAVFMFAVSVLCLLGGCSKKEVKVSVLPEPVSERDTVAAVVPVQPEPVAPEPVVDSAAIVEGLVRQALQNIYFDFDDYSVRLDAIDQLTAIGKVLIEYPSVSIMIEGHCDKRGSSDYNMVLGENRAKAVKSWLVTNGIGEPRISTTSYGKERLAAEGCIDETCYQKNRRCELKMVSYGMAFF